MTATGVPKVRLDNAGDRDSCALYTPLRGHCVVLLLKKISNLLSDGDVYGKQSHLASLQAKYGRPS